VATNALLERKGAKTAFVTTAGFEDLLVIGRQNRPELYNLTPELARLLVPPGLCFGAEERMLFDGSVERKLFEWRRVAPGGLPRPGRNRWPFCLLHSYQNDAHERELMTALEGLGYVCAIVRHFSGVSRI